MRLRYLLSVSIILILVSCNTDDGENTGVNACGTNNVLEELDWLREEIVRREQSTSPDIQFCYISLANLSGQDIFIYRDCNPTINKIEPVLNCEGTILNTSERTIDLSQLTNERIIWKAANFACEINP